MDNTKLNELLQKLKVDHDKRCGNASKGAKGNENLKPSDFKIKNDHTIEEYIKKYSSDIKHGKVKAYAENELHLMNKKTTYWDIKNNTNLKYFSLPNTLKIPFIHLSLFGKIATAAAAAAVATGGTIAGILLTPHNNPGEEGIPDGTKYKEPAAHPEHDVDDGEELDTNNPPQEHLLKMFESVTLNNSGSRFYAIYLYFNYFNNDPSDSKTLNKLDLNQYGKYWSSYTFQFVFAPIHDFQDIPGCTVFDLPQIETPSGSLVNPLYSKRTWREAIQAYMDSDYSSRHGSFNGYFWSDHCYLENDSTYYYDEDIKLKINESDLDKDPKYNDIVGTFTIDLTKFYSSDDGGATPKSYLSTGRDLGGDITLYFYPFTIF